MTDSGGLATRPWIAWFTTLGHLFGYNQTVKSNGADLPQEVALNFLPPFTVTDDPANGTTDIGLGPIPTDVTLNDVSSRVFGAIYQNAGTSAVFVSGFGNCNSGSSTGNLQAFVGPASPPAISVWQTEFTATVAGAPCGFGFMVPAGYFYKITASGDVGFGGASKWFEAVFS